MPFEVGTGEVVAAFLCLPAGKRDELAEIAVAGTRGGQQDECRAVCERDLGAVDQLEVARCRVAFDRLAQRQVGARGTGERAFVGDGERRVAERDRPLDQFLGVRGAAQEREVADAVQFGVGGLQFSYSGKRASTCFCTYRPACTGS